MLPARVRARSELRSTKFESKRVRVQRIERLSERTRVCGGKGWGMSSRGARWMCFAATSGDADDDADRKVIYAFARGNAEGSKDMKSTLGGKGAGLQEIAALGLNVPPGFTISTAACEKYQSAGESYVNDELWPEITREISKLEKTSKRVIFRSGSDVTELPLLVSIRSGAAASMPGMMDSVLNVTLCDEACEKCIASGVDARFVWDSYRRLLQMYGEVVTKISGFDAALEAKKKSEHVRFDAELSAEALRELCDDFKAIYSKHGLEFEQNPMEQIRKSVIAVFESWNNPRAVTYRRINKIGGLRGTAVNIQQMAYGNLDDASGSGVCFTRNPATGQDEIYGEFLMKAQGEDVVAGTRTPMNIAGLKAACPEAADDLEKACIALEKSYSEMMDVEFTIESGRLFILQCRVGKRTGAAAVRIATEMAAEGVVSREGAISMVNAKQLEQCLHPVFVLDESDAMYKSKVVAHGLPASPGAAVGAIVFSAREAEQYKSEGKGPCILVREETSADDVGGMWAAEGILTCRGGMTSHAAVVARGWGKPCVTGASEVHIKNSKEVRFGKSEKVLRAGHVISINGSTGEIIDAALETRASTIDTFLPLKTLMAWSDTVRRLEIRANADTIEDARLARECGATGVGLVRSEHMFFGSVDRIHAMRSLVLSQNDDDALKSALDKLKPFQYDDFYGVMREFSGYPCTFRLLDPPLHEFLPTEKKLREGGADEMSRYVGKSSKEIMEIAEGLREVNPMLGLRGCRLGIVHSEISCMQIRAVVEAASDLRAQGLPVMPEIMIPLVSIVEEFTHQRDLVYTIVQKVAAERNETPIHVAVGAMIETPRAALICGDLAREGAAFFSFGTNDLTQMTFGFSRDDSESFIAPYKTLGIVRDDPFAVLDLQVADLMRTASQRARAAVGDAVEFGVCGEQAADAKSLETIDLLDVDYVSCSPQRVLVARLAAAQAAIANGRVAKSKFPKRRPSAAPAA